MPRVVYNIPENTREDINVAMYKEKNVVVKERLLAVSMFLDGVKIGDIKNSPRVKSRDGDKPIAYLIDNASRLRHFLH